MCVRFSFHWFVGSWSEFESLVLQSGDFSYTTNEEGRLQCISFCRTEQAQLFQRYPEVVCVDATYNVNRNRYSCHAALLCTIALQVLFVTIRCNGWIGAR